MSKAHFNTTKLIVKSVPWNGSENYSEVTVSNRGTVLATAILYNHGSDVEKFIKVLKDNLK